jgi:regulator of RNase E activity RraB
MPHFPDDATGEVLRDMHAHGVDFSVPHVVEFALLFPDRETAERCAGELHKLAQFEATVHQNDATFDVLAKRRMSLDYDAISQAEVELATIASAFGGQLDGWGVLVD